MSSSNPSQHKKMAMGQPVTGMKKGGLVGHKVKSMPSSMKSTMPTTKHKVMGGKK